jgi:hypothetical protein
MAFNRLWRASGVVSSRPLRIAFVFDVARVGAIVRQAFSANN